MKSFRFSFCLLVLALFLGRCSTEVDLSGPYEEVGIIYGLLDQTKNEHVFRINKAFKGEGNAFLIAKIPDSSQYKNLKSIVKEIKNNEIVRSWELESFKVDDKDDGDFYNKNVVMYRFFEDELDEDAKYTVEVEVEDEIISAETNLVKDFRVLPPLSFPSYEIVFAANSSGNNDAKYTNLSVEWESSEFAARFNLKMKFSYLEINETEDSTKKELLLDLGTVLPSVFSGTQKLEVLFNGEQFYKLLEAKIKKDNSKEIDKRIPIGIDFEFYVAGKELHTYIETNKPSGDIVESRPLYTNIKNGYGLFSSRMEKKVQNKRLNKFSTKELCEGEITGDLKFCSDRDKWQKESFYCK